MKGEVQGACGIMNTAALLVAVKTTLSILVEADKKIHITGCGQNDLLHTG